MLLPLENNLSAVIPVRGTAPWLMPYQDRRSREDIERERERFGIPREAQAVINAVAEAQVQVGLRLDEEQRQSQLLRELRLEGIEFRAQYFEALNAERERLIDAEIAYLLRLQNERDVITLLMLAAAAAT